MMYTRSWRYLVILAMVVLTALVPTHALAHGGHGPTTIQTFTQAIGPYELAVTVEIPPSVPAPLYLTIVPQGDVAGATMTFRAAPRGQSFEGKAVVQVQGLPGPQGAYLSELWVDRDGDWDMEVWVSGPDGSGVARIPFVIAIPPPSASYIALVVSVWCLAILLITGIAVGGAFQRRQQTVPAWANSVISQGIFACVIAAGIFGFQQFSAQAQAAQAAADVLSNPASNTAATPVGRPHANMALHTTLGAANASQTITLTLDLSDGSTGLPVEDLIPHHEALIHLVVISADGGYFNHLHPPRSAPGRYGISLTPDRPGRYTAYAEIQRQDSGTQVIARDFEVGGTANGVAPPITAGLGSREVAGMQVNVTASTATFRAGKQATFTFSFSANGAPVQDLQPWLGMGGHLIARSADGATFAHIHAQGPVAPSGVLASGVNYGPDIRFVYTFPQPGRYQIWGQFKRNAAIVTVPLVVEVAE